MPRYTWYTAWKPVVILWVPPSKGMRWSISLLRRSWQGAELILLRADNVDDALVEYAEKNGIDMIIMGSSPIKLDHETIVTRLQRRLPNVEFDIIGQ